MELFNKLKELALVSKSIHILDLLQIFLMLGVLDRPIPAEEEEF